MQPNQNVVAALAEVSEAELSGLHGDSSSSSVHSDSAGSVHGSDHDSVDTVTLHERIMGVANTSLAQWAHANSPPWLTPEARQEFVDMFLAAAQIYQEWDAEAGQGSNMLDLYYIDEADGEAAAAA